MNNRTELLCAVKRQIPERIPYTYDARPETSEILRKHLGLNTEQAIEEYFDCNSIKDLWDALKSGPKLPEREEKNKTNNPNIQIDKFGVTRQLVETGGAKYFEVTHHPLADAETIADIERYDWPECEEVVFPELPDHFDLNKWKEKFFILDKSFIGPYGVVREMFGMEKMMMDMILNPAIIESAVAKVEEFTLECLKVVFEKYRGMIDMVGSGDDYGTQNGLIFSVDLAEKLFMPSLKRHLDLAKKYDITGYHHSCGSIFDMIPSFIKAGVEVLNPIQTSAEGMEPEKLKSEFGNDLAFHGGMDIQQTLLKGNSDEVREAVRFLIDTLGPDGYILGPSHLLQPDIPSENILSMYEEAKKYGSNQSGVPQPKIIKGEIND